MNWQNEEENFYHSMQELVEKSLNLIEAKRIQNNLSFDGEYIEGFLGRTNLR